MKRILFSMMLVLLSVMLIVSCDSKTVTPEEYIVSFNTCGGTVVNPVKVKNGERITGVITPEKPGFEFTGWLQGEAEFDIEKDKVTSDMILTARWIYKEYKIGDTGPGGGKIFYDSKYVMQVQYKDADGNDAVFSWRYLEAAPTDLLDKDGKPVEARFGYYRDAEGKIAPCGAVSQSLGTGWINTQVLVRMMGDEAYQTNDDNDKSKTGEYAAKLCSEYRGGGLSDWCLPSHDALLRLIEFSKDSTNTAKYWTCSEVDGNNAYFSTFNEFKYESKGRCEKYRIRPIRLF